MGLIDGSFMNPFEHARLQQQQQQQQSYAAYLRAVQPHDLIGGLRDYNPFYAGVSSPRPPRKHVESRDVTSVAHKQITGAVEAVKKAQENAK